jgi:hypothetical protein
VYPKHLWPPLELVEAALEIQQALANTVESKQVVTGLGGASAQKIADIPELLLPLNELSQRRAAVAAKAFSDEWCPGRLLQITSNGLIIGVLLDRQIQGRQWVGWSAACETSWASDWDVLLELEDDPFEPMFGVIQTWNPVTIELSTSIQAKVVGELSALRLEAVRAVAHECAVGAQSTIPVEPGRIALRMAIDKFLVLTGTPLSEDDERHAYQNAYRSAVARLMAKQLTQRLAQTHKITAQTSSGLARVKAWFAADWLIRPAFVATATSIATYFLITNIGIAYPTDDESVRFRSAAPSALSAVDLRVQVKPQSPISDVEQLMRNSGCEIVSGPDAQGFYSLRSHDVMASKAVLAQSTLVLQVTSP